MYLLGICQSGGGGGDLWKERERNQERQIHQNMSPLSTCSVSQQLPESFYKQKVNCSLLTISPSYLLHPTFPLTIYNDLFLFPPSNILVSNYQPVLTLKTQAVQFSILRFFQLNKWSTRFWVLILYVVSTYLTLIKVN